MTKAHRFPYLILDYNMLPTFEINVYGSQQFYKMIPELKLYGIGAERGIL